MTFSDYLDEVRKVHAEFGVPLELAPACSDAALIAAETRLGFRLDPGLRAAWTIADGSQDGGNVFARPGFLTGYEFLSLDAALAERESRRRIAPNYDGHVEDTARDVRIRPGWFQQGWLPFAGFGGGTLLLMLDHSPAEAGKVGQIIAFTHDPDEISYVTSDFASLLHGSLASIREEPEDFLQLF